MLSQSRLAESYIKLVERKYRPVEIGTAKIFGVPCAIFQHTAKWVWVLYGNDKKEIRIPRHFLKGQCIQGRRHRD